MVEFKILRAARRGQSKLTTMDSGEQTLAFSGICSVECHGIKPWREEEPKKAE